MSSSDKSSEDSVCEKKGAKEPEPHTQEAAPHVFQTLGKAISFFAPLYPHLAVEKSLNELITQKGRGALTESYCHTWLKREVRAKAGDNGKIKAMTQERWNRQLYNME